MTVTWYEMCMLLAVPSIIAFLFQMLYIFIGNKIKKNRYDDKAIRKGIQALLRNQLIKDHDRYINEGYVDVDEKSNYENMYNCYHNLGENGVMDNQHKEVMRMPTVKPDNKD